MGRVKVTANQHNSKYNKTTQHSKQESFDYLSFLLKTVTHCLLLFCNPEFEVLNAMSDHKKSVVEGINSLAQAGALFAGASAGLEVVFQEPPR